jgi:hypothetical protein
VAAVISSRLATLEQVQTIYSTEDIYDLLEIMAVDANNRRMIAKKNADSH